MARMSMGDVRLLQNDMVRARGDYELAAGTMERPGSSRSFAPDIMAAPRAAV